MTDPVTPIPGLASEVPVGGTSVIVIGIGPNGGVITNPSLAGDQGLPNAERLYVNPVGAADVEANGTTFALEPGQTWTVVPGQTTSTSVNADSNGHKFSVFSY